MDCGKRAVSSRHENISCLMGLVLLGNSNTSLHPAVKVRTGARREGAADCQSRYVWRLSEVGAFSLLTVSIFFLQLKNRRGLLTVVCRNSCFSPDSSPVSLSSLLYAVFDLLSSCLIAVIGKKGFSMSIFQEEDTDEWFLRNPEKGLCSNSVIKRYKIYISIVYIFYITKIPIICDYIYVPQTQTLVLWAPKQGVYSGMDESRCLRSAYWFPPHTTLDT